MASPKNEAFIDLEVSLTDRLDREFRKEWIPLSREMQVALDKGDYDKAHALADRISMVRSVGKNLKFAKTMGVSALLLGASRVARSVGATRIQNNVPDRQLDMAMNQFEVMLRRNGTLLLQKAAHQYIHDIEDAGRVEVYKADTPRGVRVAIQVGASSFNSVAASMHISRLNSFGFLAEAVSREVEYYRINEVMDTATCPVCQQMNDQVFPVEDGISHAMNIMSLDDPDGLRMVAPWPRQDSKSLSILSGMSVSQLIQGGLALPPYHPGCRGIADVTTRTVDKEPISSTDIGAGVLAGWGILTLSGTDGDKLLGEDAPHVQRSIDSRRSQPTVVPDEPVR